MMIIVVLCVVLCKLFLYFSTIAGNKTPITNYPPRKWDTKKRLLASIELANNLIDYKPITNFGDGLKANVEWFKTNWDKIQTAADFPIGMSSAVRKK